ncbi:MAG: triose-phosphate isomerase [Gemmatimonadota bacterium]
MRSLVFAANWKMHLPPEAAREFANHFLALTEPRTSRQLWFFPSAVSLEATSELFSARPDIKVGCQDIYWEPKGAFTGATSIPLARGAGAAGALVGHSERRHVFGETDQETGRKVRALLAAGLVPMLCVGEKLEDRDAGLTEAVVRRQLAAGLEGVSGQELGGLIIAYEPVWAIGTGKNATPADAAVVHRMIRLTLSHMGAVKPVPVLYGGSVNRGNVLALLAEPELDGVLVGGASLDPEGWAEIVGIGAGD